MTILYYRNMTTSPSVIPEAPPCPKVPVAPQSYGSRLRLASLLDCEDVSRNNVGHKVTVCGWSRTIRKQGGGKFCFVALSDGSTNSTLQVIVESCMPHYDELLKCGAGCAFRFDGTIVESPAAGQAIEMKVSDPENHRVEIYGSCDASQYPLAKKKHGPEFLREIAHLRPRTYLIGAVARMRSAMAMATHRFFQDRGFLYVHTPLITAADCEGAGEMFQVTTIMGDNLADIPTVTKQPGVIDYKKDFFGKKCYLTVSGQLALENYACSLCDVYTFGPTFRAENSHTSRHLAEFWMIEPEMAFCDIQGLMASAEAYIKYCVEWALINCEKDLQWFDANIEQGLIQRLKDILAGPFARVSYTEAVEILEKSGREFQQKPEWGFDMGAEHERYLTEQHFKKPTVVYNYPADLKAFYMRANEDGKTVAAMDVLLPKIGEVIGGSQREERLDNLSAMIKKKGLPEAPYWWYLELRKYGTVPHSGFGLGFERLIMLVTGIENIRDVIPFPRFPQHAEF